MFSMSVFEKSCFKRFFQSILSQMYHSLVIKFTLKKYTLQECVKFKNVTDHDILIY